ncbi:MAG: hypothetical protein IKS31_11990 [Clostridia bacterium]|nr:hypothetical protein [Clostridia bacterium]MBR4459670.1 hypothetical protein [Clostridia bacterium]
MTEKPEELLGLPLEEALRRWAASGGAAPRIVFTAPGGTRRDPDAGTPRLVCVRADTWICARFLDGDPQRPPR